jgi:cbb3-type cytochrome oxidase subunit 3
MNGNSQKRALFRFSIRTIFFVTVVVAAFLAGRKASKDEVAKLELEVAQNRALADHAFDQLNTLKRELQKPTIDGVMQGDARTWSDQLRGRLPIAPEQLGQ